MNKIVAAPPCARDPLLAALLTAAKLLESRMDDALARVGLTTARYTVLEQLAAAGEPLPLSELAARVCCVRSNMTQLIDRLEAEGLVSRIGDPADRRAVRAELTELGAERLAAGARHFEEVQQDFSGALGETDRALLERLLATLA